MKAAPASRRDRVHQMLADLHMPARSKRSIDPPTRWRRHLHGARTDRAAAWRADSAAQPTWRDTTRAVRVCFILGCAARRDSNVPARVVCRQPAAVDERNGRARQPPSQYFLTYGFAASVIRKRRFEVRTAEPTAGSPDSGANGRPRWSTHEALGDAALRHVKIVPPPWESAICHGYPSECPVYATGALPTLT